MMQCTTSATAIACGLLLVGCTTIDELSAVPPGHPAHAEATATPWERSSTLNDPDPIDPRPDRAEQFMDDDEPHDHGDEGSHDHDEHEDSGHEPNEATPADDHDPHEHHQ